MITRTLQRSIYISSKIVMPYTESNKYVNGHPKATGSKTGLKDINTQLLQYILKNSEQNNPDSVIKAIDLFCREYPMINIGEDKCQIVKDVVLNYQPKSILDVGGYFGYSSLIMAFYSQSTVLSFEPIKDRAQLAKKIHQHSGLSSKITTCNSTIHDEESLLKKQEKFDLVLLDHEKQLYLPDLQWLTGRGLIKKGTVILADNIIYPGCPEYHQYLKQSPDFESILYFTEDYSSRQKDGLMVSQKLKNDL